MPYNIPDTAADGSSAVFITTVDLSVPSACTMHVAAICGGLAAVGWNVTLIAPGLGPGKRPGVALEGPHLKVRWTYPLNRWGLPRTTNILAMVAGLLTCRRNDILLAYVRFSPLTPLLVLLVRMLMPKATIITEHNGWVASEASMSGWPNWMCQIVAWLQQQDARLADAVRTVTRDVMNCLTDVGVRADRIFVAENGADLNRFKPIDRRQAKIDSGLDPDHIHVGFLGTLTPWQGVDVLLRAAAILVKQHPDLRVVIGGAGGGADAQQALAESLDLSDRVTFMGWVPGEHANRLVNAFDIAVAPYNLPPNRPIGSPVKLRDYAAAGRPVVAAGYPVVVQASDESWCLIHRPGDHAHLALRLEELLADPQRREAMGVRARSHAEKNFSWDAVVDTIISHLPPFRS